MRTFILLAIGAGLCAQTPPQQPPADEIPTLKVDVDVVNVLASVRDKRGGLVANLEKKDFTVFEDGKQQEIKYFTRETDLPLTIGLLVDVSGSQRNLIEIERSAAAQFFSQVLRKKDEAFLIMFGEEAELLQDYTNSPRLLTAGLSQLRVSSGVGGLGPGPVPTSGDPRGTVLYDAVYLAANEKMRSEVGRKVIVVITDGVDEGSRLPIKQAVEAAQKADAVIYSIDYSDPGAYGFGPFGHMSVGGGEAALRQMSDETGGHVYRVDRRHTLDQVFTELQEEMRSQYSIGYTPLNDVKDGSYRKLDIRASSKDLKVQARKGYYATKPEAR
ncbi:MAG TPA: VWA domain-containing protein [Bryobacteraceae bacterium]|nr:VWA domain-containing protein [Bryobacteraceae bacterium]